MGRRSKTVLTDTLIKRLKPKATPYRQADGHTPKLYVVVTPRGTKNWEYWYQSPETGKNRPYPIGSYPAVSLKDARDKAKSLLKQVQ